jgi:hypothetical protein
MDVIRERAELLFGQRECGHPAWGSAPDDVDDVRDGPGTQTAIARESGPAIRATSINAMADGAALREKLGD